MRLWNFSFRVRILLTVAAACLICAVVSVVVAMHFNEKQLEAGLIDKGRTVLSRLTASTEYIANQGGLRIALDAVVQKHKDASTLTDEEKLQILKQVPIFAAMKIGAKDADREHYAFRVFSDEPRRKENLATPQELEIFKKFEQNPSLQEQVVRENGKVTVFQPVRLSENQGCLNCHGNPSTSPWKNGKDVLGFRMEDWKDGKLHGVFAVTSDLAAVRAVQANSEKITSTTLLILFIALGSAVAMGMAAIMIRAPIAKITHVAGILSGASVQVSSVANEVATTSEGLSQATTEQAASLQETSASIEEMSSMVAKNSDNARRSSETSELSQRSATRGQQVVQEMIQTINDINSSNANIMNQINQSNARMSEIVKVIGEIQSRTKVINEIVFQTKLLSFNASVEAARAGEHGKGFSVVAEEVGSLAQMSGNAAKDISGMLEASIQKVESIVTDTRTQVERLIQEGRSKVEAGTRVAHQCGGVLEEIVMNVTSVTQMANEISVASQEQSHGILEIKKAVNQLDEVTQQNAVTSQKTARAAEALSGQAESLDAAVRSLAETLNGAPDVQLQGSASAIPHKANARGNVVTLDSTAAAKSRKWADAA